MTFKVNFREAILAISLARHFTSTTVGRTDNTWERRCGHSCVVTGVSLCVVTLNHARNAVFEVPLAHVHKHSSEDVGCQAKKSNHKIDYGCLLRVSTSYEKQ